MNANIDFTAYTTKDLEILKKKIDEVVEFRKTNPDYDEVKNLIRNVPFNNTIEILYQMLVKMAENEGRYMAVERDVLQATIQNYLLDRLKTHGVGDPIVKNIRDLGWSENGNYAYFLESFICFLKETEKWKKYTKDDVIKVIRNPPNNFYMTYVTNYYVECAKYDNCGIDKQGLRFALIEYLFTCFEEQGLRNSDVREIFVSNWKDAQRLTDTCVRSRIIEMLKTNGWWFYI